MIFDRMDGCCENFRLIGIERDPDKVQEAGDKFGGSQVAFITGDVEESDFIDDLADKMDEMGIEKFDIINISMLLLHLKSECALLRRLRRLLKPEGTVIIKDIDAGINFAYPDEENVFERIYRICDNNETSGGTPEWATDLYQPAQSRLQKDRIKKIWFYNHRSEL